MQNHLNTNRGAERTQDAIYNQPLAMPGLFSYRCSSPYGWVMIGAKDDDDALKEARRSNPAVAKEGLQRWNGEAYEPIMASRS